MKPDFGRWLESLGRPLVALVVAFILGGVIIALVQRDISAPFAAYSALFAGAFGSDIAIANTLRQATPLLLTGLAVSVALSAGLFNIGAEGQMAVGALAAATVGFTLKNMLPPPILLLLSLVAGMGAAGFWAVLPPLLKVTRGAHEVITAILLNYIAQNLTRYLASGPLREAGGQAPQTPEVGATLPRLVSGYDVHVGLIIALFAVAFVAFALRRSVLGYETRMVGTGYGAAEAAGIPTAKIQVLAFVVSGALAGLAGAVSILGEVPFRRFVADFYGIGYGFDGLAVALLAAGSSGLPNPLAIIPCALLFGGLSAGAEMMEFNANIPKQVVMVVQAILIATIGARLVLRWRRAQ
jgi:general nucleoside transport system permease protein